MEGIKELCKYGSKCYRKNAQHRQQYRHGSSDSNESTELQDHGSQPGDSKKKTSKDARNAGDETIVNNTDPALNNSNKRLKLDDFFTDKNNDNSDQIKSRTDGVTNTSVEVVNESNQVSGDEDEDTVQSPEDPHVDIKNKFLVEMPDDFFEFWDFAKSVNARNPSEAFASSLGLHLVGPYDVLAGKTLKKTLSNGKKPNYLLHWRYYYDPPEFLTVIRGDDKTQYHMGYYRDDPSALPVFVGSNKAAENCSIKPLGENIFAAVNSFIDSTIKQSGKSQSLSNLQTQLKQRAMSKGLSVEQCTPRMKERDKKVVSKTFHGAGIVVPVDKNGVGYRPLPESPTDLRKILKRIVDSKTEEERDKHSDQLTEIITLVQFANDECDYGEGVELGIDLFCYGSDHLHGAILGLLPLGYQLLKRRQYSDIISAHLSDRRKGPPQALDELAGCK